MGQIDPAFVQRCKAEDLSRSLEKVARRADPAALRAYCRALRQLAGECPFFLARVTHATIALCRLFICGAVSFRTAGILTLNYLKK